MKTLPTREEFIETAKQVPDPRPSIKDLLSISGYLNLDFNEESLENNIYKTIGSVKEFFDKAFPGKTEGIQEPFVISSETSLKGSYSGLVYIVDDSYRIGDILVTLPETPMPPNLRFEANFPLGNYTEQSKNVIGQVWPMIIGIEYAQPNIPTGAKDKQKFKPGSILLIKDGDAVATGDPALTEIGLDLPHKRKDYICGSIG